MADGFQTLRWERFESALWSTTSLLLVAEGESLVIDPGISSDDVAAIDARARALGAPVRHMLITHGDWDHVCGIAAFSSAAAIMGEATAERVASGAAERSMRRAAERYGLTVSGSPRVDRTIMQGSAFEAGPFLVETFGVAGHTHDGTAYRFRELGLLVIGDHLSSVEFPFATTPAAYRMTLAGLIELLRHDPPTTVIPGHGRPLDTNEALAVAEADLEYLRALHAAVVATLNTSATREQVLAAGAAVELPRECSPELAEMRLFNVEKQLEEISPCPKSA